MTSVSAGHIILTPTQPVGSGRSQRESNPGPPHQESRALQTGLPRTLRSMKREEKHRNEDTNATQKPLILKTGDGLLK